ncbi:helix-turn-helix domain-containing protein [Streptomyces diacarni]|uniref:helix-turn-helix transcriptional regulator n=1 Tax=Streptomyces diacarni TaxID=2800381 RepID=UPI0033FD6322
MAALTERTAALSEVGLSPLLKLAELQAYYGVSNWTVYKWIREGCPTEPLPGKDRRFDLERVRAWVAERNATGADA